MNKIIIGLSLCVASSVSFAATAVCATGTGSQITGDTANFVKSSFTPKCSANTSVGFAQGANTAAVGAISTKGNQIFGGHTNGGAVAKTGDCTTCAAGDATGAADTMLTASSS